jgi:excisionase family DNA binding protein
VWWQLNSSVRCGTGNPYAALFRCSTLHNGLVSTNEPIRRLCYSPDEAAAALGIGRTMFYEQVLPELRVIRLGRKRLVPLRELERWTERESARILG